MGQITGLNHITFSVKDVDESFDFYTRVLGFKPAARWPEGAYLEAGDTWIALVLDSHIRKTVPSDYTHIAFTVSGEDFEAMSRRILAWGAEIWQPNKSEGASLYFLDPNGHKLEIHVSDLSARLRWLRENPTDGLHIYEDERYT